MKVVKVNVDVAPEISQQIDVQGREVSHQVGAPRGHALRAWIDGGLARRGS